MKKQEAVQTPSSSPETDILYDHIKDLERLLAASNAQLSVTLDAVADAVITADTEGRITGFNAAAERLTGRAAEDTLGSHIDNVLCLLRETDKTRAVNPMIALAENVDTATYEPFEMDALLICADGAETPVSTSATHIIQKERCIGTVLILRDVSKQRAAEEEMHRVQKLEAVGILAGGIAHDFNNILTAVMGNISLARRRQHGELLLERLKDAEKALARAQGLTNQLLTFSKGGSPIKTVASVQRIIEESAAFSLIGSAVKGDMCIPDDLWRVEVDEGQISQVIQNLVINADQAMTGGGTVRVEAENRWVSQSDGLPLMEGQYVVITVADEGVGIPAVDLDRVFDPYFTTKENGTGLGLATTHSIIRRHGGHISVESKEGRGTSFSVFLPATEERISGEFTFPPSPLSGSGRVLVMDDEPTIRDIACMMLDDLGFTAEAVADGAEAVALYNRRKREGTPFDAVIVDLTVPGGLGGKEALPKLKNEDPGARVIVSSGYSNDPVMSEYKTYGFSGRVTKPYGMKQLAKVLKKVLYRS